MGYGLKTKSIPPLDMVPPVNGAMGGHGFTNRCSAMKH